MKRITSAVIISVLFFASLWLYVRAQEPPHPPIESIDDQTPPLTSSTGKVDPSDEQRIPEAYATATGGPDLFGYTYSDSDGEGCSYNWIEIEATGSALEQLGDEGIGTIPIGFPFPFYGRIYSRLMVEGNGALLFEDSAADWVNRPLGMAGPSTRLAPFWDDLSTVAVYYRLLGSAPRRTLVISSLAQSSEGERLRFQTLLGEDGRIVFQYQTLSGALGAGTGASVGIQGPDAGLGYLFNGYPEENRLHEGLAVCFRPPAGVYLSPGLQNGYAPSGQTARYTVFAINQTGVAGTFDFTVDSPWPAAVTPRRSLIPAGARLELVLTVHVPAGPPGEQVDTVVQMIDATGGRSPAQTLAHVNTTRTSGRYGYTGASTTDEVAVFDLQTLTLTQRLDLLPEGDYPYDATIKPVGSEVWIPGANGDAVIVIDTAANTITRRIGVGEYPIGVAFRKDSVYAFVSNRDTEDLTVIDTRTYAVEDTIPIPTYYLGAGNVALNPCGGELYVVDYFGDHLFVLDGDTFTVTQELSLGSRLWQLVVAPLGHRLYVTDRGEDVVHVIDTTTLSETATIPVGDDPWGIDIVPDGSLIYVTNEDSHDVTVIDALDHSVITTVTLPHADADPRDVDFSADGAYAFVTSGDVGFSSVHDEVYVIDTATHTVVERVDVDPARNSNVVAVAPQMARCLGVEADKRATPGSVVLGDPLTYTIHYAYTSLISATGVLVTDSLPPGTVYLTSTGGLSSTYNVTDHQVVWDLGTVPPGASGTLTALTQPLGEALVGQVITNAAYLDFTSARGFSATVSATSTVLVPELTIRDPEGRIPSDPLLLCEGDQVTLAASTNHSSPLDYSWDLGDGTRSSTPSVTHAWNYGSYTVRLTIINTLGWVETDTLGLQVGHVPVAGFTSNSPVELGQNAVFTDRTTYEPSSWLWDFGDGVGTSDEPNPIYNYSNRGGYEVTLTVTNRCGTDVYVDRFQVGEYFIYLPLVARDDL